MTLQSLSPNSRQEVLIESACRSPTRLTNAKANRRAVLSDRGRRSADWSSSNGGPQRALRTVDKSQFGTVWGWGRFNLLALLRNLTTRLFLPADWGCVRVWFAAMAATYTSSVDGMRPLSGSFCKKVRMDDMSHEEGSSFRTAHQSENKDHLRV